jgi:hypothetical protein
MPHLRRSGILPLSQRSARLHESMIGRQLLAEVQSLFLIGTAGSQLVADPKVSTPRLAAATHLDLHLLGGRKREKLAGDGLQIVLQVGIDSVAVDIKEPALPTGRVDLGPARTLPPSPRRALVSTHLSSSGSIW